MMGQASVALTPARPAWGRRKRRRVLLWVGGAPVLGLVGAGVGLGGGSELVGRRMPDEVAR